MKVHTTAILALAAVCLCGGAASLRAAAEEQDPSLLFLPTSYEQYLALETPADVALNGKYIAIADGSTLYLYDRAESRYTSFSHTGENGRTSDITKVQFTLDGRLYYSDLDTHLYRYDFETGKESIQTNVPCSTFVIDGEMLYTASVTTATTFYGIPCNKEDVSFADAKPIGTSSSTKTPSLFIKDGTLYCAVEERYDAYTKEGDAFRRTVGTLAGTRPVEGLTSAAVLDGKIYYSTNVSGDAEQSGIYVTGLDNTESSLLLPVSGIRSLSVYGGKLYCVQGTSVRELEVTEEGLSYTGYEIASSSDSPNRLNGATDTVRAKDLIVTADRGNERATVYNAATGSYTVLMTGGTPDLVATDGETIAVAVTTKSDMNMIMVYAAGDTEPGYVHVLRNPAVGLVCVFGRTYYVTSHVFGEAAEEAQEIPRTEFSPAALASDVFGNLYVADRLGTVTKFTEEEFLDPAVKGALCSEGWSLPEVGSYTSFRSDFCGNLYYLVGNDVYRNGEKLTSFGAENAVYYGEAEVPAPASFALGYEDNALYVQFGNFILQTEADFPTLSAIDASGVHETISEAPTEVIASYTEVRENATGIHIDLAALDGEAACFAYRTYERKEEGGLGIKLAEKDGFELVALFEHYGYTIALFRKEDCSTVPVAPKDCGGALRYTTNEIAFTYFPCLSAPLTMERLPRGSEVTLLYSLAAPGRGIFDYAFVRCGEKFGYLPLAYLTEGAPAVPLPDEYMLGYLKANPDGLLLHAETEDADDLVLVESTQVKIYDLGNGLYRIAYEKNGVVYTAQVTPGMIRSGNADALRISLIIILCVLAVTIIAAYVMLVPKRRKYGERSAKRSGKQKK